MLHAIHPDAVIDCTIKNCYVWNVPDSQGMQIATRGSSNDNRVWGPTRTAVEGCLVWDTSNAGTGFGSEADDCVATNNLLNTGGLNYKGRNGVIEEIVMMGSGQLRVNETKTTTDPTYENSKNVRISDCHFSGGADPLVVNADNDVHISGCTLVNAGVLLDTAPNASLRDIYSFENPGKGVHILSGSPDVECSGIYVDGTLDATNSRGFQSDADRTKLRSLSKKRKYYRKISLIDPLTISKGLKFVKNHFLGQALRDAKIVDSFDQGIQMSGADATLEGVYVSGAGGQSIVVDGSGYYELSNVHVSGGSGGGIDFYSGGMLSNIRIGNAGGNGLILRAEAPMANVSVTGSGRTDDIILVSSITDQEFWNVEYGSTLDDRATRTRWNGVIGGGPLGGKDISALTGASADDRAMSDGSSGDTNDAAY